MSSLSIFLVMLNEEWHVQMYDHMRTYSWSVTFFWVFIIITGEVLIMKLYLALFINNYLEIIAAEHCLEMTEEDEPIENEEEFEDNIK